ncbi:hypothetical protein HMPREF0185_00168 [Brevundimonas diminuta 470-4]|nr:hypothetical protein HMPREF0185_00168 [Brevundimonas diminuta 470-4]
MPVVADGPVDVLRFPNFMIGSSLFETGGSATLRAARIYDRTSPRGRGRPEVR